MNGSRPRRKGWRWVPLVLSLVLALSLRGDGLAESAIDLLSGFDVARIEAVYPPRDETSLGELAKLAYRINAVDTAVLETRVGGTGPQAIGNAVTFAGEIRQIQGLAVPQQLVEFLEFSRLFVVDVAVDTDSSTSSLRIVTASFPEDAVEGDRVAGFGVVIEISAPADNQQDTSVVAVVAPRPRWFPRSAKTVGWQLLSNAGMDIGLLADAKSRSRMPLLGEDGDAFYSMLSAAAKLGLRSDLPAPDEVVPVTLLGRPDELTGQWLRLDLETVQVTRIAVNEPHRQSQLGSDHYYQVDAVADLGHVVVKIERGDDDPGPPAVFENRYPVSVVARELPDFLMQRIRQQERGDAVVSQHRSMIAVDAFFYRLWSYSTDFMNQHGGGDQFGPLLFAARMEDREPPTSDPAGVHVIGSIAAVSVISAIVAIWLWARHVSARDAAVRRRRRAREAEQVKLP